MAIQTKSQLSASNATSFPDNVSGFITPALLRNFNTSSIDSYAALSGSNTFVGNQVITGSVIATSFTGSLQGTASYALVAEAANTIGNSTINGIQTYTYSQTLNTGGTTNLKETKKFVTGSFGCISGSWTKFMNISHSTATWRGSAIFAGTNMTNQEFGITQTNFVLRAGSTSDVSSTSIKVGTNVIACPDVSASWNGSSMDIFARSAYNLTGSLLVDMTINLSVTGSTITFF